MQPLFPRLLLDGSFPAHKQRLHGRFLFFSFGRRPQKEILPEKNSGNILQENDAPQPKHDRIPIHQPIDIVLIHCDKPAIHSVLLMAWGSIAQRIFQISKKILFLYDRMVCLLVFIIPPNWSIGPLTGLSSRANLSGKVSVAMLLANSSVKSITRGLNLRSSNALRDKQRI